MRTTTYASRLPFIVDPRSIVRNSGRQINWSKLPSSYIAPGEQGKRVVAGTVVGELGGQVVPCAASQTLTSVVVASNVATATLVGHGYAVGDKLTIAGGSLAYANGAIVVASVPDADTFTYAAVGADASATGTITARPTALAILETNAHELSSSDALTGYSCIIGGALFGNLLPDATGSPKALPEAYVTELQAAGTGFAFESYANSIVGE